MSMLSAQCDELRALAGDGSIEFIAGPIRADILRMAADTIWELRCKLNDEQDENTRLRSCLTDAAENARLIMGENAELRELVRDYVNAPCTTCDCWDDNFRCWNYDGADCGLVARARELGVEVDG